MLASKCPNLAFQDLQVSFYILRLFLFIFIFFFFFFFFFFFLHLPYFVSEFHHLSFLLSFFVITAVMLCCTTIIFGGTVSPLNEVGWNIVLELIFVFDYRHVSLCA